MYLSQSDVHVLPSKTIQELISTFLSVLATLNGPIRDLLGSFVFVMLFFFFVIFSLFEFLSFWKTCTGVLLNYERESYTTVVLLFCLVQCAGIILWLKKTQFTFFNLCECNICNLSVNTFMRVKFKYSTCVVCLYIILQPYVMLNLL